MINFRFIWILSTILCLFFHIGCVGPPDPEHGLVENFPVVINTADIFSYSLYGNKYSSEELYDLNLIVADSIDKIITHLIISDYSGSSNDISTIYLQRDSTIYLAPYPYYDEIISNFSLPPIETVIDSVFFLPNKTYFVLNQFSGILKFIIIRSNNGIISN